MASSCQNHVADEVRANTVNKIYVTCIYMYTYNMVTLLKGILFYINIGYIYKVTIHTTKIVETNTYMPERIDQKWMMTYIKKKKEKKDHSHTTLPWILEESNGSQSIRSSIQCTLHQSFSKMLKPHTINLIAPPCTSK